MNYLFKIIGHDAQQHSIIVRYYSDTMDERYLATEIDAQGNVVRCRTDVNINLPYPAPTDAEILDIIKAYVPVDWFEHLERGSGANTASLQGFLDRSRSQVYTTTRADVDTAREPKTPAPGTDPTTNKRFSPRVRRV